MLKTMQKQEKNLMISFDLCNKINLKFSIYMVFHQNLATSFFIINFGWEDR